MFLHVIEYDKAARARMVASGIGGFDRCTHGVSAVVLPGEKVIGLIDITSPLKTLSRRFPSPDFVAQSFGCTDRPFGSEFVILMALNQPSHIVPVELLDRPLPNRTYIPDPENPGRWVCLTVEEVG